MPSAAAQRHSRDSAFLAGLLSLADALLGIPLAELLGQLHIEDAIREALLEREGSLGDTLEIVELLERGRFRALEARLAELRVPSDRVAAAQRDAYAWQRALDPAPLEP